MTSDPAKNMGSTTRILTNGDPATPTWSPAQLDDTKSHSAGAHQIGPYRIVGVLGEGGMGTVYRAEQTEPVQRMVALKVIRAAFTSPTAVARFAAERQAMARLNHINVAQIFEAGTTREGWPYFVMEHIDGADLLIYSDDKQLSVDQRLRLFIDVCKGVQHAHQRGIMHRDLKPNNLLVTEIDGRSVPKIIDFGIAKALDGSLTGNAQLTNAGTIGTPAYMSPEALPITGDALDLDTRADVYALGVILYELLTGGRPSQHEEKDIIQFMVSVSQRDAPKPSTWFSEKSAEHRSEAAEHRQTEPDLLQQWIEGDLDWIVSMAIARDREERYGSAMELAADIERYLADEPVVASPPSWQYRLRKFGRRNRLQIAAASVLALSLVLGAIGTTVGMVRANHAAELANREADRANYEAAAANENAKFLSGLFAASDSPEIMGNAINAPLLLGQDPTPTNPDVTARELLDVGARKIQDGFQDQPVLRSRFMHTIGRTYLNLGLYGEAESLLQEALWIRERTGASPLVTANTHSSLGEVYKGQGRYDDSLASHERAIEIQENALGSHNIWVAGSLQRIGGVYIQQGRYEEAEPMLQRSLEMRQELLGSDHKALGVSLNELGLLYANQGKYTQAEPLYERSLALSERHSGPDSAEVALRLNNLAHLYDSQGRQLEAEPLYGRALAIYEEVHGSNHPFLARSLNNLALVYDKLGRFEDAERLFRRAVEINTNALGPDHPHVAICLNNLAVVVTHQERYAEAGGMFERALEIYGEKLGFDHPRYARTLFRYAEWHVEQGLLVDAELLLERAMSIQERKLPREHPKALATRATYAALLRTTGRDAAAFE